MLTNTYREKLSGGILRAALESNTLEEFGCRGLPLLDTLIDTSISIIYRVDGQGYPLGVAGALEEQTIWAEQYFPIDPMCGAIRRLNRKILHASECPEWKLFLKHAVYVDFARHCGVHDYLLLKLTETIPFNQGAIAVLLARARHQPAFTDEEKRRVAQLLPALDALGRRNARVENLLESRSMMQEMAELDLRPRVAFDIKGNFLWASERAESLLGLKDGMSHVPEKLTAAVRRIKGIVESKDSTPPVNYLSISGPKGETVPIALRLAKTRSGKPFVIAELELPALSPHLEETAARFGLTASETHVLNLLAQGLPDRHIGRRLFVSLPTIRTHVSRIFAKLGVHSRVQAALLAHGIQFENGSDSEELNEL